MQAGRKRLGEGKGEVCAQRGADRRAGARVFARGGEPFPFEGVRCLFVCLGKN